MSESSQVESSEKVKSPLDAKTELAGTSLDDLSNDFTRRRFLKTLLGFSLGSALMGIAGEVGLLTITQLSKLSESEPKGRLNVEPLLNVEGKEVQLVGVLHNIETFIQYQEEIRELIRQSPFLITEYFSKGESVFADPNESVESIVAKANSVTDSTQVFFGLIAREAALQGKDVLVLNPETALSQHLEAIIGLGFAGDVAFHQIPEIIDKLAKKKLSRRSFLRLAPAIPAAMVVESWRSKMTMLNDQNFSELSQQEKESLMGWSLLDFRDLKVAKGLFETVKRYQESIPNDSQTAVIQGVGHLLVGEYLKKPDLIQSKELSYLHYDIVSKNTGFRHAYDKNTKQWKLVDSFDY